MLKRHLAHDTFEKRLRNELLQPGAVRTEKDGMNRGKVRK
jgi:hypothetical protein